MQQLNNGKLSGTAYADHLRGCADLAKEIASRLDIREDSARQACLATIIISADRHNLFIEPVPRDFKTPVIPETAAAAGVTEKQKGVDRDAAAAEKADAQIAEIDPNPTPEKAETVNRSTLLQAIDKGRTLLNKAGYTPIMTPKMLNEVINGEMSIPGNLGTLDLDQLEAVIKMLATRLDTFKSNMKAFEPDF